MVRTVKGNWLIRGRDGRLGVYLPTDDAVLYRAERVPGGPWESPRKAGGDQTLHAGFGVGQGPDGYAHLVAWRPTPAGGAELVHSTHFRPLLAPLDWTPFGHPNKDADRTGDPVVAVDVEGRAHLFVRNRGKGVSMRNQKERGGLNAWHDLRGSKVQELIAVTGESGRIEVYAASPTAILRWYQQEPGRRPVAADPLPVTIEPGTLAALPTSKEHTTLFYADPEGMLYAWRPDAGPRALLPVAGPGPVTVLRCDIDGHDCTLLAQRSASGRVAFAAYPTEQETAGLWWTESGPELPEGTRVALAQDATDRVVAATLTPDGTLRVARRKDEPGLALEAWRTV
ncbi:hypothetical protein [Streptomyces glaucescens]|uniref:LmbE family protein n=1 Tax=Streptomyces glaucescens TaxID=1907 RepID=A0A089XGN4_STRGA|nr:hypothetical protein [Streptomyces glaucescens]AIS01092.1 hypothetical protein SGLAU_25770 [Streptomyces glaucescens]